MNIDLLPYEINTLIISYLVPKEPKSLLDIESYVNLSLVNKEFRKNVVKCKNEYIRLKDMLKDYKFTHKCYFEIVKYQLMDKIPIILPSTSNEGCLTKYCCSLLKNVLYGSCSSFNKSFKYNVFNELKNAVFA